MSHQRVKPNRVYCEVCEREVNARISRHHLTAQHLKALAVKEPALLDRILANTQRAKDDAGERGRLMFESQLNEELASQGYTVEVRLK
jgi:hypothetical protein